MSTSKAQSGAVGVASAHRPSNGPPSGARAARATSLKPTLTGLLATSQREQVPLSGLYLPHVLIGSLLAELLGKPDENSFGAPDVAEPIRLFVLDHFADKLRVAFSEPGERIADVVHGEHDA